MLNAKQMFVLLLCIWISWHGRINRCAPFSFPTVKIRINLGSGHSFKCTNSSNLEFCSGDRERYQHRIKGSKENVLKSCNRLKPQRFQHSTKSPSCTIMRDIQKKNPNKSITLTREAHETTLGTSLFLRVLNFRFSRDRIFD